MRPSIVQILSKLWMHIQYYKYEPSKPTRSEFLRLDLNNQASWIENNIPEYDYNLYGDNYLGCSYEIDEDILQEYLDDREDYDTSGLIAEQMPDISKDRIDEIYEGAELTDEELECLKSGIANSDESGWKPTVVNILRHALALCTLCMLEKIWGRVGQVLSSSMSLEISIWH